MVQKFSNALALQQRWDYLVFYLNSQSIEKNHNSLQNEWIDKFEVALKFNQIKRKKPTPLPPIKSFSSSKIQSADSTANRTSYSSDAMTSPTSTTSEISLPNIKYAPDWVAAAPEEIQALIAQRHFEEALTLIKNCEEHFARDNTFSNAKEIEEKVFHSVFSISLSVAFSR